MWRNKLSVDNIIKKTEEYLQIPSVVGFEAPFLDYIARDFSRAGYDIEKKSRILSVKKRNSMNPKIISAHIDRHGIVCNENRLYELAASYIKRRYNDEKISEEVIKKWPERIVGEEVYAYDCDGKKISEGKVSSSNVNLDERYVLFVIEGMGELPANTPISYKPKINLQKGNFSCQLDNVISAAVAYYLIQDGFDGTILFSGGEEVGRSGDYLLSYLHDKNIDSKEIISLDTTPYEDNRTVEEGRLVLRNRDARGIFNPDFIKSLKEKCEKENIAYEFKDEVLMEKHSDLPEEEAIKKIGKTDLGKIIEITDGRYNGATIQLPATGYHTNHETTSINAIENYYKALKVLLS